MSLFFLACPVFAEAMVASARRWLWSLMIVAMLWSPWCFVSVADASHGHADAPVLNVSAKTGGHVATYVEQRGNVAVIEFSGNYDRLADGESNIWPRAVVAQEFYRHHPDLYDFIVVFSAFEFATGDAVAFHHGVKNDIAGIGKSLYDNSKQYGSQGRLMGFVDMAALSRYAVDSTRAEFDWPLQVFSHEVMHQWAAFVGFKDTSGKVSKDLIGQEDAHWSFLLDSDASLMYGNRWRDNGNGTYTSVAGRERFSSLDLYLMGLAGQDEVAPMTLLVAPDVDKSRLPEPGVTIKASPRVVTIQDIVAAEGPRLPAVQDSRKDFNFAFVYLVRPGQQVDAAALSAIEGIRKEAAVRFNALTHGRATANAQLLASTQLAGGEPVVVVTPGEGHELADGTTAGLQWLLTQQRVPGAWGDLDATDIRDTAQVLQTLQKFGLSSEGAAQKGRTWLRQAALDNTDALARRLSLLGNGIVPTDQSALLALTSEDGGRGLQAGYASNPLDSALALQALRQANDPALSAPVTELVDYLLSHQNADGGWPMAASGPSRITATTLAMRALAGTAAANDALARAAAFVVAGQQGDGGYGQGGSSVHETALAMLGLLALEQSELGDAAKAVAYLTSRQRLDGSWDGSVYATALALEALAGANIVNWSLESFDVASAMIAKGQPAVLSLTVRNTSGLRSPQTRVRLYDGPPEQGGTPVRSDIVVPPLPAGSRAGVVLYLHTLERTGAQKIVAVVNPDHEVDEFTRQDNVASTLFAVTEAAEGVDLLITDDDLTISPVTVQSLPATLTVDALLTNAGSADAALVKVVLWEGREQAPKTRIVASAELPMPAQTQSPLSLVVPLAQSGKTIYTLEIDPDQAIGETSKSNNSASRAVTTVDYADIAVSQEDIDIVPSAAQLGDDMVFSVTLHNRGTTDSPSFRVQYTLRSDAGDVTLPASTLQIAAGQTATRQVEWRATSIGDYVFEVTVDPENQLVEDERSNNTAVRSFHVGERVPGPNLALSHKDIQLSPNPALEGKPLKIAALVRNTGTEAVPAFEVAFYAGVPGDGGMEIGARQSVDGLAPGESIGVDTTWPMVAGEPPIVLYVVADPDQQVSGEANRSDNRAFASVEMLTLPDLAVSRTDVLIHPSKPRSGDTVDIRAKVSNLGQQPAEAIKVRLYAGTTDTLGQLLAERLITSLPGQAAEELVFQYTVPQAEAAMRLHLIVDPEDEVQENHKENNKVVIALGAQDMDFDVSERYFSPNGDKIKDVTELSFRLKAPADVRIDVIREDNGRVVRSHRNVETLSSVTEGYWVWDGTDDRGVIAKDGAYTLAVIDSTESVLGQASVVLDNNRSSVLSAIGTPHGHHVRLIESVTNSNILGFGLTKSVFFVPEYDIKSSTAQIYRIDGRSGGRTPVFQWERNKQSIFFDPGMSGEKLVVAVNSVAKKQVISMDAYGQNRAVLAEFSEPILGILQSASGASIYILVSDGDGGSLFWEITVNGDHRLVLASENDDWSGWSPHGSDNWRGALGEGISPGRDAAVVSYGAGENGGGTYGSLAVLDFEKGTITEIAGVAGRSWTGLAWSPDGQFLLVESKSYEGESRRPFWAPGVSSPSKKESDEIRIKIYNRAGKNIKSYTASASGSQWNETSDSIFILSLYQCEGYSCGQESNKRYHDSVRQSESGDLADFNEKISSSSSYSALEPTGRLKEINVFTDGERVLANVYGDSGLYQYSGVSSCLVSEQILFSHSESYANKGCAIGTINADVGEVLTSSLLMPSYLDGQLWFEGRVINLYDENNFSNMPVHAGEGFYQDGIYRGMLSDPAGSIYYRIKADGGSDHDHDLYAFNTSHNLFGEFKAARTARGRSVRISGTADDLNFLGYRLEYRRVEAAQAWQPIIAASDTPVRRGVMATWIPPGVGKYEVRLTVEDSAGNQKQIINQVNHGVTPVITDLHVSPRFISPNGDGANDTMTMRYRVLEPVNFDIEIYDSNDVLVRTATQSHPVFGIDSEFNWDGRDESGLIVPDGEYRIMAVDYEANIVVDNTPPAPFLGEPALSLSMPFGYSKNSFEDPFELINSRRLLYCSPSSAKEATKKGDACMASFLKWRVKEAHPDQLSIEQLSADGAYWYTVEMKAPWVGENNSESVRLIPLPMNAATYRIVARDKAGNQLVQAVSGTEQIFIGSGFIRRFINSKNSDSTQAWGSHSYFVMQGGIVKKFKFPSETQYPVINVYSSLQRVARNLFIEYREKGSEAWIRKPVPLIYWNNSPAAENYEIRLEKDMVEGVGLQFGRVYEYKFLFYDEIGGVFDTPPRFMEFDPIPVWRLFRPKVDENEIYANMEYSNFTKGSVFDFYLKSDEDPRYAVPQKIATFTVESPDFGIFSKEEPGEFRRCVKYQIEIRPKYMDENGEYVLFDPSVAYADNFCDFIYAFVTSPVSSCGEEVTNSEPVLEVSLTATGSPYLGLDHLVLGRKGSKGDDIHFNVVAPEVGKNYRTSVPVSLLAQGENNWFVRTRDVEGREASLLLPLIGDTTPTKARIIYPLNGQKLCGRMLPDSKTGTFRPGLEIEAEVSDPEGWLHSLSVERGGVLVEPLDSISKPLEFEKPPMRLVPPVTEIKGRNYTSQDKKGVFTTLFDHSGEIKISLSAWNWGGTTSCEVVTAEVDAAVEVSDANSSKSLFSPYIEPLMLTLEADELVSIDTRIYRAVYDQESKKWQIDQEQMVRSLPKLSQVVGGVDMEWDGRDAGGQIVADGVYGIALEYTDACSLVKQPAVIFVEVDATPPVTVISSPEAGDELSMLVGIVGEASDKHFRSWRLEYAIGASPEDWQWSMLANGLSPPAQATLALWNTNGLPSGDYSVRLSAEDRVGNRSETTVVLQREAAVWLLTHAQAQPSPFSPNGDGRRDTLNLSYGLERSASMTVTVTGQGVSRTLLDNALRSTGIHNLIWDGLDDAGQPAPDGFYKIHIEAIGAQDAALRQKETLDVVLDRAAPVLVLALPESRHVKGTDRLFGGVTDANPDAYRLSASGSDGEHVLGEGIGSVSKQDFGDYAAFPEGKLGLTLIATDLAENSASLSEEVTVDHTPPQVAVLQPQAHGFYRGTAPLPLTVDMTETHPKRWTVKVGQGPPASWSIVHEGLSLPIPADLTWTPTDYPDGEYVVQLQGEDLAGWLGTEEVPVVIDNTPPVADIAAPLNGATVSLGTEVVVNATDLYLDRVSLEVAPGMIEGSGANEAAIHWTELISANNAFDNAVLTTLPALPAGTYTLRLTVTDKAGNTTVATREIVYDAATDAMLLHAEVEDSVHVRLAWTPVVNGELSGYHIDMNGKRLTATPIDGATTNYRVEYPGYGSFSFVVHAITPAGTAVSSNTATVVIQSSALQAYFTAPRAGDVVAGQVAVNGTAAATNDIFKEYRLYVVPGDESAAALVAEEDYMLLRQSPLGVQNGELGTWDTTGLVEGSAHTLKLVARDIHGGEKQAAVSVTIDNVAPARPKGLQATVVGADVLLSWEPNTEADLAGYLLYRDGVLVNMPAEGGGAAGAYVLHDIAYDDKGVPDGDYLYTLEAIDHAGNRSEPSDPAAASLDNRAPRAVIVSPVNESRVTGATRLLATTEDKDIAAVQFEYRTPSGDWQLLGKALVDDPYEIVWQPKAEEAHGAYLFRAIATDRAGNVDTAPPSVRLIYSDQLTRVLKIKVNGGAVTLDWTPSDAESLDRYQVRFDYGTWVDVPASEHAYQIQDVDDGVYDATVRSVDGAGKVVEPALDGIAIVHTPVLVQPFTPIAERGTTLHGNARMAGALEVAVGGDVQATGPSDEHGGFSVPGLALTTGINSIGATHLDAQGNRSKTASVRVVTGDRPAAPQDLQVTAFGAEVVLNWTANIESDLWGYLVTVDGVPRSERVVGGTAQGDGYYSLPALALDGDPATYWVTRESWDADDELFTYIAPEVIQATAVRTAWQYDVSDDSILPVEVQLEGWDGEVWVPLTTTKHHQNGVFSFDLGDGYRTDRLRLRPLAGGAWRDLRLTEFEVQHTIVSSGTQWQGRVAGGTPTLALRAVSTLGLVGPASAPAMVFVDTPELGVPQALTVAVPDRHNTLDLQWQPAPQVAGQTLTAYRVHRSESAGGPYAAVATLPLSATQYRDTGLTEGRRVFYVVHAVDDVGNESAPSNEDSGVPTGAFDTPFLMYPAAPSLPYVTAASSANVHGMAAAGAAVTLLRADGQAAAMATAAAQAYDIAVTAALPGAAWSPDGMQVLLFSDQESRLYGFSGAGDEPYLIRQESRGLPMAPLWHFDGSQFAFVDKGVPTLYRALDGVWWSRPLPGGAKANGHLAWARDGRLAVGATLATGEGALFLLPALIGGEIQLLASTDGYDYNYLDWSPDGQALAYVKTTSWEGLPEVLSLADGTVIADFFDAYYVYNVSGVRWDRSGRYLIMTNGNDVWRYALDSDASDSIDLSTQGRISALPYGDAFVVRDQQHIFRIDSATLSIDTFGQLPANASAFAVLPGGHQVYTVAQADGGWRHVRHTPSGLLRLRSVGLTAGENRFTAQAPRPDGGSVSSAPVVIEAQSAQLLPDYTVSAAELLAVPGVPKADDKVRISIRVHNRGQREAQPVDVVLAVKPDGSGDVVTLHRAPMAGLAPGTSATVLVDWTAPAAGRYQLVASVDPDNLIAESDETNNVAWRDIDVTVAGQSVGLHVALGKTMYDQGEAVEAVFTATNGGIPLDARLSVAIEDLEGYLVTRLPPIALTALASGEARAVPVAWPSGNTFAGQYRVRGEVLGTDGKVLATATVGFGIRAAQLSAKAQLVADRTAYVAGQVVALYGTVEFLNYQAVTNTVPVSVAIADAAGTVVFQDVRHVVPSGRIDLRTDWAFDAAPLGAYTATLTVGAGEPGLARADTAFSLVASSLRRYTGQLSVSAPSVKSGDMLQVSALLENIGQVAIHGLPVSIVAIDPQSGRIAAEHHSVIDIPVGSSQVIETAFDTKDWLLRTHVIALQVEDAAASPRVGARIPLAASSEVGGQAIATAKLQNVVQIRTLHQEAVSIFETDPPIVTLLRPLDGAIAKAFPAVRGFARDALSALKTVEYRVDGGVWRTMLLADPLSNVYAAALAGLSEGAHSMEMRATDVFENTANASVATFIVDTTPPVIAVEGIVEAGSYASPVTPAIVVTDLHLAAVEVWLDGELYVPGTAIAEDGAHVLTVVAGDVAGNQATLSLAFVIDKSGTGVIDDVAPVITILSPAEGAHLKSLDQAVALIVDAFSGVSEARYRVDGGEWQALGSTGQPGQYAAATGALADGTHTLAVTATDHAGNVATPQSASFTIDATPPLIVVDGVANGGKYAQTVIPAVAISDAHLVYSETRLNGAVYADGSAIVAEGNYVLTVEARDRAGNESFASIAFDIVSPDSTPPVVTIVAPAANALLAAAGDLMVSALDAGTGIASVEYRVDGGPWLPLSPQPDPEFHATPLGNLSLGEHVVDVRATDLAGNVSQPVSVRFTLVSATPLVDIITPFDEAFTGKSVTLRVRATDPLLIGIERVRYRVDGAGWLDLPVPAPDELHQQALTQLGEGIHLIDAQAFTPDGRMSAMARVRFTVDTVAPVIEVRDIADRQHFVVSASVAVPVVPDIRVIELHPDVQEVRVDGLPFTPGDPLPLELGSHVLDIVAIDKAGNRASLTLRYTVGTSASAILPIPAMPFQAALLPLYVLMLYLLTRSARPGGTGRRQKK